jgi:Protein of unknown function DUF115
MVVLYRDQLVICTKPEHVDFIQRHAPLQPSVAMGFVHPGVECIPSHDALVRRWGRICGRNPNVRLLDPTPELQGLVGELVMVTVSNQETTRRRGRRWVTHLVKNLDRLCWYAPAVSVRRRMAGVPAIIVGAGPSLDSNVHLLEEARWKALVIGVNSATKATSCDVQVCLESNDVRPKLGHSDYYSIRAYSLTCMPEVCHQGDGQLAPVWSGELGRIPEGLTGHRRIPTSASGSTAAVSLALAWGCDPIILVGHDLGLTGDRMYAGATGAIQGTLEGGKLVWNEAALAQDRPGNPLQDEPDTAAFKAARRFLRDVDGVQKFNCTEGGEPIENWPSTGLSATLEGLRSYNPNPGRLLVNALRAHEPVVNYRMLREWRDEQLELCGMVARVCLDLTDCPRESLESRASLLLEGLGALPLLEPWAYEPVSAFKMGRQSQIIEDDAKEQTAAEHDLRALGAVLFEEIRGLKELLKSAPYDPL